MNDKKEQHEKTLKARAEHSTCMNTIFGRFCVHYVCAFSIF